MEYVFGSTCADCCSTVLYCSTCCPVVIGVLYTVSSFVRYSLCLWRGLPPFVPTKDYYLGRYSRVTCSLGSFTVQCTASYLGRYKYSFPIWHLPYKVKHLSWKVYSYSWYSHFSCQVQPPLLSGTATSLVRYSHLFCQVQPPLLSGTATSLVM